MAAVLLYWLFFFADLAGAARYLDEFAASKQDEQVDCSNKKLFQREVDEFDYRDKETWLHLKPHCGFGYESAFDKCWTGPEEWKQGQLLPEFDDFVKKYHLTTPDGAFDMAACP
eukprot:Skav235489  [mRNA]  locus=scaffold153:152814:153845:+ [translate_table: standard]